MSGTLKKAPSEGDVNKKLPQVTTEEPYPKKTTVRKTKSLASERDIRKVQPVPDFKRGITSGTGGGGVRLVWRTSTSDFDHLNKILGLPQTFRSASPKPNLTSQIDHVFSENFNPLAVQKRASTDNLDSVESDELGVEKIAELPKRKRTKSNEYNSKDLEMVSVKSLKSMFENIGKKPDKTTNAKPITIRRSQTISGLELSTLNDTESRNMTKQRKSSQKIIVDVKEKLKSPNKSNINSSGPSLIEVKTEQQVVKDPETSHKAVKTGSESVNARKIKNLLNIFEEFEKTQSVPSGLNEMSKYQRKLITTKEMSKESENEILDKTPNKVFKRFVSHEAQMTSKTTSNSVLMTSDDKTTTSNSVLKTSDDKTTTSNSVLMTSDDKTTTSNSVLMTSDDKTTTSNSVLMTSDDKTTTSNSVLNLKMKWESLISVSPLNFKANNKVPIQERKPSIKVANPKIEIQNIKSPQKKELIKIVDILKTSKELPEEKVTIQRNGTFRNSVKDIAQLYEIKKTPSRPQSAPSTPSSPKKEVFSQVLITSGDISSPAQIRSTKINRHPSSKSLEQLKRKFSINIETEGESKPDKEDTKEKDGLNQKSLINKEISLASLERKSSVKNMMHRFESSQNKDQTMKTNEQADVISQTADNKVIKVEKKNKLVKQTSYSKKEKDFGISSQLITEENKKGKVEKEALKLGDKDKEVASTKIKNDIKIEINNTDINSNKSGDPEHSKTDDHKGLKIEELIKDFKEAEGISNYLKVPKKECLPSSNSDSADIRDMSHLMKATDTFKYPDLHDDKKLNKSNNDINDLSSAKISTSKNVECSDYDSRHSSKTNSGVLEKVKPKLNADMRSGSRELKEDELKFFRKLSSHDSSSDAINNGKPLRERSSSIESSSPTSTLSTADLSKSKLRSSSRQFRDLHTDELRFFGVSINGTPNKSSRSGSEVSLRQEALEKALKFSSLEEDVGRKE